MSPEQFEKGLEVRRAVMGDAFVDRALANLDDFSRPLQELVTGYAWGEVWTRPGLDRRTRSLLNLAMLTALNRGTEFKGHVRGAINNGVTVDEIKEILLQQAIYCGVPAANHAVKEASAIVAELGL